MENQEEKQQQTDTQQEDRPEESVQTEETATDTAEAESVEGPEEREQALQDELEEWKRKAEENQNQFLRAKADLENFRRRAQREKEESRKYRSASLAESLLPAFDNFERALAASRDTGDTESLIKGVEMVFKQMQQALEQEGIEPIEAVGKPFDPHFHEAVAQEESDEYESGIVMEEMQKGYKLKDRVIRPSMVKVSS